MLKENLYDKLEKQIDEYYEKEDKNIWRNYFHIEMPFGLVNDPNGLSYYNGEFYIFYQWNPFGCEHKNKHWGLVRTKDFINFSKPQIALKPIDWFDKNGCYSGCGIVKDDKLKLFYTGNVKDENNVRSSYQCIATYDKSGKCIKDKVVIDGQPEGYTAHFRDPYIFVENEVYYAVIGTQTDDLKGKVVIYNSKDLEEWNFLGELKTNMNDFGYMWECPNMIKLEKKKYAFIFSPQGIESEEFKFQNIYQSGYVMGDLDVNTLTLNHEEFKELDMGFEFYAPQVFNYNNENIMISWIGMPEKEDEYPSAKNGDRVFALSMPRVLEEKDGVLYQRPFKALEGLRKNKQLELKNIYTKKYLINPNSRALEIKLNLKLRTSSLVEIKFKFMDEYISLIYNRNTQVCLIDRNNMKLKPNGVRKFKLKVLDNLKLHIFIDNSIMEIYYQDGIETTTLMYFTKSDELSIEMKSDDCLFINELDLWNLKEINYN